MRTVKDYDERMNEFVDIGIELMLKKGYEKTTVQEIIDAVGVSKGAFYHYFSSKEDLLKAGAERMAAAVIASIKQGIEGKDLPADAKLREFLAASWQWKSENLEYVLVFAPILFREENARLMKKAFDMSREMCTPILRELVQQGIDEGVFEVKFVTDAVDLMLRLMFASVDAWIEIASLNDKPVEKARLLRRRFALILETIEKLLGASPGSLGHAPESYIKLISMLDPGELMEGAPRTESALPTHR
jgi:AcrR family transcriptional regulator